MPDSCSFCCKKYSKKKQKHPPFQQNMMKNKHNSILLKDWWYHAVYQSFIERIYELLNKMSETAIQRKHTDIKLKKSIWLWKWIISCGLRKWPSRNQLLLCCTTQHPLNEHIDSILPLCLWIYSASSKDKERCQMMKRADVKFNSWYILFLACPCHCVRCCATKWTYSNSSTWEHLLQSLTRVHMQVHHGGSFAMF